MASRSARFAPLLACFILLSTTASATAQGLGMSFGAGLYGPWAPGADGNDFGVGAEVLARWAGTSGVGAGVGLRVVGYRESNSRATGLIEVRYVPHPPGGSTGILTPILGLRAGPFVSGGGNGDGNPLYGVEAAPVIGAVLRASPSMSLTLSGELLAILWSNEYGPGGHRRVVPGIMLGVVLH